MRNYQKPGAWASAIQLVENIYVPTKAFPTKTLPAIVIMAESIFEARFKQRIPCWTTFSTA